jgi:hypothetical protein
MLKAADVRHVNGTATLMLRRPRTRDTDATDQPELRGVIPQVLLLRRGPQPDVTLPLHPCDRAHASARFTCGTRPLAETAPDMASPTVLRACVRTRCAAERSTLTAPCASPDTAPRSPLTVTCGILPPDANAICGCGT